jgi:hypothetical protein
VFKADDGLEVAVAVAADPSLARLSVEVSLISPDGTLLWRSARPITSAAATTATLTLTRLGLADGNYRVDVAVFADDGRICCDFQKGLHGFAMRSPGTSPGLLQPVHTWSVDPAPRDDERIDRR